MQFPHPHRKAALPFLLLCFVCLHLFVNPLKAQRLKGDTHITDEQLTRLQSKTVLVVLPSSQYNLIDDYKQLVSKAWTLTPVEVIKYSDLSNYSDGDKYAYLAISGTTYSGSYTSTHYYLTLSNPYQKQSKRKAAEETDELCWMQLYPDTKTQDVGAYKNRYDQLYEGSLIRNFTPPYIYTYLKYIQTIIKNGTIPALYSEDKDGAMIAKLSRDTLYVPDSLVHHRSGFSSKEELNEKELFASYQGKYKIVSTQELTEMIKNKVDKKPLFLFEYVLSSTDKFVSVYNVTTGERFTATTPAFRTT